VYNDRGQLAPPLQAPLQCQAHRRLRKTEGSFFCMCQLYLQRLYQRLVDTIDSWPCLLHRVVVHLSKISYCTFWFGNAVASTLCVSTLQRHNTENSKQIFPERNCASPQSQFPHSCVCERFIYFHNRSAYSAARKYVDRSWEYVDRSQTHECGNWDWGPAIPRKGIHKWDVRCSAEQTSVTYIVSLALQIP
jgi:hypothetical protein